MKKTLITGFILIISGIALFFNSCVKDVPDDPPTTSIPFDATKVLTIAGVKQMMADSGGLYLFKDVYSIFATVVMDEKSGNIYKSSFIQDSTGGLQLNFFNPSGLYSGDSIRIMIKGGTVQDYHGLIQINNLDPAINIYKIANGRTVEPKLVTIQELNDSAWLSKNQSTLIKIEGVQFSDCEIWGEGKNFVDSLVNEIVKERRLEDCNNNTTIIRTSEYASFAGQKLPKGNGTLLAIASLYDFESQLTIRDPADLSFTELRCDGSAGGDNIVFFEGFDYGLKNWENISLQGDQVWQFSSSYGNPAPGVQITGYNGSYHANEDWLISPSIDLTNLTTAYLSIETAKNYSGNPLQVRISTDYNGMGDPSSATWNNLQVLLSPGNNDWQWVPSGQVNISAYVGFKVYIAFRYTSTNTASATWELDNLRIVKN